MKARMLLLIFTLTASSAHAAIEKMNDLIDQTSKEETSQNKAVLGKLPDSKTMTFYQKDWEAMRKKKTAATEADVDLKIRREPAGE